MTRSEPCSTGVATTTPATTVAAPLLRAPRGPAEAAFNDKRRIAPHAILRCSIFGIVASGKRKHFDKALLPSPREFTVRYTGLQLDKKDEDVWLELVDLLKYEPSIFARRAAACQGRRWRRVAVRQRKKLLVPL